MRKCRNKRIAIITTALLFAAQFFAVSLCFADDDFTTIFARDDTLFLSVPAAWQTEEFGSIDEDADMIDDGQQAFKILEMQDSHGTKQGELWIYAEPGNESFYFCDSKEETEEYYNESGTFAVDYVIEEKFPDADSWSREADIIEGEDGYTCAVREKAEIDGTPYLIYLTCEFTSEGGIHEVMFFEGNSDRDTRDRIAESIEGYSYANELIDNRDYNLEGPNSFFEGDSNIFDGDVSTLFSAVIWLIIWVAIIAFAVRKIKGATRQSGSKPVRSSINQRKPARKSTDNWVFRETKKKKPDQEEHADCQMRGGGTYAGYHESLKTLHKSGLLTTKEMNELLEKHKNDF